MYDHYTYDAKGMYCPVSMVDLLHPDGTVSAASLRPFGSSKPLGFLRLTPSPPDNGGTGCNNVARPHQALSYVTPLEFVEQWKKDQGREVRYEKEAF